MLEIFWQSLRDENKWISVMCLIELLSLIMLLMNNMLVYREIENKLEHEAQEDFQDKQRRGTLG